MIAVCAVVATLVVLNSWMNAAEIHRGVEVGSVPVGGKTPEEARKLLEERAGALGKIELAGGRGDITAQQLGIEFDAGRAVEDAYAVGRRGGFLERLAERAAASFGGVRLSPEIRYDRAAARSAVEDLARRLDEKPRDASVLMEDGRVMIRGSRTGYELDRAATTRNIGAAIEDLTGKAEVEGRKLEPEITTPEAEAAAQRAREAVGGDLVLGAGERRWTLSPADVGAILDVRENRGDLKVVVDGDRLRSSLSDLYAALVVEPVEAGYEVDGTKVSVTPGRPGKKIEERKLFGAIEGGIFEGR